MIAENSPDFISYLQSLPPNSVLDLECPQCMCHFTRAKNVLQSKFITHNMKHIFCSHDCASKFKTLLLEVECKQCLKIFLKRRDQVIKSPNNFCTSSCAAKYNNTHKIKGTRRSKLEIWVEEKLKSIYPNIEFKFNKTDHVNYELDIFIPSLRLAFELNGLLHFKPIYGADKLSSIQNNDNLKYMACFEKGTQLVVIDTSDQKHFSESNSQKYLDLIISQINNKQV